MNLIGDNGRMDPLTKMVLTEQPSQRLQFRKSPYGNAGCRDFLRDVIAMANADVDGPRYIVVGVELGRGGRRDLCAVKHKDFAGNPPYQALVADHVEPPVRIRYRPLIVDDVRIGVFEIAECQDRPYMMRIDHSETLRRGDAFARVNTDTIKLGRQQLQAMFEARFRDAVSADRIEIGFPGDIIHKDVRVKTVDLTKLPSAVVRDKLKQLLAVRNRPHNSGSTTLMERLTHARLFGAERPYRSMSAAELMRALDEAGDKHRADDERFLFEKNATAIQLVVCNQGDEPIEDASLSITLPNREGIHVAEQLPRSPTGSGLFFTGTHNGKSYPAVSTGERTISASNIIGTIGCGSPVSAFGVPLRICVSSLLKGRKLGLHYALFGSNLREPVQGKLRLLL